VTEAMDERGVDLVEKYGDCVANRRQEYAEFSLLKYVGQTRNAILLKRGLSATLDELLLAAEYIMAEGNYDVIFASAASELSRARPQHARFINRSGDS
jgi:3-deoxy-7-phosphoheptulonate synthase